MRVKLLNVLTVCAVTLVLSSPSLVIFGVVRVQHLELLKIQNFASTAKTNNSGIRPSPQHHEVNHYYEIKPSIKLLNTGKIKQHMTARELYRLVHLLQLFFVLIPTSIGLGIILYDRYLIYRANLLQKQIEMLEKLWEQSIEK
jgi:hypothetical protein